MKPVLFDDIKKILKLLDANYDRSAEQSTSSNFGKNRENFYYLLLNTDLPPKLKTKSGEVCDRKVMKTRQQVLIIVRDNAASFNFGSDNTYLVEGGFSDSGFIGFTINITTLKFIHYV